MKYETVLPELNLREADKGIGIFANEIKKRILLEEKILDPCLKKADPETMDELKELPALLASRKKIFEEFIEVSGLLGSLLEKRIEKIKSY